MQFTLNHNLIQIDPLPGETLSDLLRERLHLTGTKIACRENECGACTVLLNGEPILACNLPAARVDGKTVLTIEGLAAPDGSLHPLQTAFIEHGAVQCGFCIPAQILTAYALLQREPNPTSAQIRHALKDTLCRCAGYPSIERAILAAAGQTQPLLPNSAARHEYHVIGSLQPRPEAHPKVTGAARFTDDLHFPGMLHAAVLRAEVPAGILESLDTAAARALPGVVAILTAQDLPAARTHGIVIPDWAILVGVGEPIRYVGDALAIVAAERREIARKAVTLLKPQIRPLEPLTDPVVANQTGARNIHEKGNLLKHIKVRKGDVAQGFADADVVLEGIFHTPATDHAFMEPECSIALPLPDGRMEIYVGSQIPYADRNQVAAALGWQDERVRVVGQLMGGGFGGKEDIAGQIHAALLANATGKPVKLLWERRESLLVHPKRHATQIKVKLGARRDGTLTAVQTELYGDTGAYASLGEKVLTRATTHSSGPYQAAHVQADCYATYTNNPPAGAFRGFGVLQSAFAIETMMDELAQHLQMNPIELRRRNALRVGSVTSTGQTLRESVGLLACIEQVSLELARLCAAEGRENPFTPPPPPSPYGRGAGGEGGRGAGGEGDEVTAWGFACAYKNTGLGGGAPDKAEADVELYADGHLQVRTASAELGQGLVTVLRLVVAEEFRVPPEQVDVLVMDTDLTPDGGPTTASRQTYVTGNAARHAAQALKQLIAATLAEKFDKPPERVRFVEGLVQVDEQVLPFSEVYALVQTEGRAPRVRYEYWAPATQPLGTGGDMHFAYSFAAQAAEVAVNRATGEVRVLRVIAANDVGRAINPLGLQGQVEGGIMMGLGHALMEHFVTEQGYVVTDRLARYRIPSIVHTPKITSFIVEDPTAQGPYGAKGVGEIVSIPIIPAITNAIYNAVGVRVTRLPVDQELILQALRARAQQ